MGHIENTVAFHEKQLKKRRQKMSYEAEDWEEKEGDWGDWQEVECSLVEQPKEEKTLVAERCPDRCLQCHYAFSTRAHLQSTCPQCQAPRIVLYDICVTCGSRIRFFSRECDQCRADTPKRHIYLTFHPGHSFSHLIPYVEKKVFQWYSEMIFRGCYEQKSALCFAGLQGMESVSGYKRWCRKWAGLFRYVDFYQSKEFNHLFWTKYKRIKQVNQEWKEKWNFPPLVTWDAQVEQWYHERFKASPQTRKEDSPKREKRHALDVIQRQLVLYRLQECCPLPEQLHGLIADYQCQYPLTVWWLNQK